MPGLEQDQQSEGFAQKLRVILLILVENKKSIKTTRILVIFFYLGGDFSENKN